MATSSIFADFSIKDKKTARAFVRALEASAKDPFPMPKEKTWRLVTEPEEVKKFFGKLFGDKK